MYRVTPENVAKDVVDRLRFVTPQLQFPHVHLSQDLNPNITVSPLFDNGNFASSDTRTPSSESTELTRF